MFLLQKLAWVAFVGCAPVWAQSSSVPPAPGESPSQQSQPSQVAPASDKQPSANQNSLPGDSTKLVLIKIEKAVYPLQAREKEMQGEVWVKVGVSETGDVESVDVISGDPIFGQAAVEAVRKWKFKPFIKNGKPVKVSTKLPIDFAFEGNVHQVKAPEDDPAVAPVAGGDAIKRVRVSSGVTSGLLVSKVQPVYPTNARRARIQGIVVLKATISKEGRITDLQLISGPKELADAAIGAVQQWRYRPYMLMGQAVEVETQIQVKFELR